MVKANYRERIRPQMRFDRALQLFVFCEEAPA